MSEERNDTSIDAQARRFVLDAAMQSGAGDGHAEVLERWCAGDPRHRKAYEDAQRTWLAIGQVPELRNLVHVDELSRFAVAAPTVVELPDRQADVAPRRRRLLLGSLAAAALVGAVGLLLFRLPGAVEEYSTKTAEIRDVELNDGTHVTLGARSKIEVRYSDAERTVQLLAGEAFFRVARDVGRPFQVTAEATVVRAVGTEFEVHKGVEQVRVAVTEGIVEVSHGDALASPGMRLTRGEAVASTADRRLVAIPTEAAPAAWRQGRLFYTEAPLIEVVDDANRYFDGHIQLASPQIGALRITGSFRSDRIDQMLQSLPQVLPVQIQRNPAGQVTISASR